MLAVVSCGALVAAGEPVTISLLRRAAAFDVPNERSSHTVPTPRGGGAPIAIGLVLVALVLRSPAALAFAIAVAAFAAIGLADDLTGLPAGRRLMLQGAGALAAATALVIALGRVSGAAGAAPPSGLLASVALRHVALTAVAVALAIWITGFVNAFNFMDGVNGISGVHAALGGAAYAALGAWRPDVFLIAAGGAVAAGALAFLPWNAVRARVFLGDVGSYGLGAALAVLAGCAVIGGVPPEAAAAPVALYLADTGWTLLRRIRAGERCFEAHRTHTYQQLCDAGWSHQRVTAVTAGGTLLLCLLGAASLAGDPALRAAADLGALAVLALYLRAPVLLGRPRLAPGRAGRHRMAASPGARLERV